MMMFLEIREQIKNIYQRFHLYINPIIKFIVSFIIFQLINNAIGYDERFTKTVVVLGLSAVCAILPTSILVLLSGLVSIVHIYSASMILAVIIIVLWLIAYCLFIRYAPRLGYVILAVPVLYILNIPYLVPLVVGLLYTPMAIIPTGCGVFFYYLLNIVKGTDDAPMKFSIEDALSTFTQVLDSIIKNKQMIITIVIFSLIIVVVYIVRRLKIDYAREIAIGVGTLTCILAFLISDLTLNISDQIGSMILGSIVSALLTLIISVFYMTLDYTAVEHVQFEDEDYYYYVKAVPKVTVTAPERNVKKFNSQKKQILSKMGVTTEEDNDYEEEE